MQIPKHIIGDICDKETLERVRRGDAAGMARLYELYKNRIYALCLHHTSNVFDAEDLTQEIFIQVFRKIGTFRGDAQLGSWIYKVGLNSARLHGRRQRRLSQYVATDVVDEAVTGRPLFRNPAQGVALKQALSMLTPVRRKTLLLHDIHGLTHFEIASRMGVTVIASKSRLHRAHVALRHILGTVPPN